MARQQRKIEYHIKQENKGDKINANYKKMYMDLNDSTAAKNANDNNSKEFSQRTLHKKVIQIDIKTLEDIIEKHSGQIKSSSDWITPFSVFLTCVTTLLFSNFHDVFFINKEIIQAAFVLITLYFLINALRKFVRSRRIKDEISINSIMQTIRYRAEEPVEKRLLFLIITKAHGGKPQLLLYKDMLWDCWFLPNTSFLDNNMRQCKNYIAGEMNIQSNNIVLDMLPPSFDCVTRKVSKTYGTTTDYWNQFCFVKIKDRKSSLKISELEFDISGRPYKWMTTTEMMSDTRIQEINMDIVSHLHDKGKIHIYNGESLNLKEMAYGQ